MSSVVMGRSITLTGPAGPVPVHGIASGTYHAHNPERTARYRIYEIANGAIAYDVDSASHWAVVYSHNGHRPALVFSPEDVQRISDLGASIDVDFYPL